MGYYDQYGYLPVDLIDREAVSKTLEFGYDDYSAALLAKKLGKQEDYEFFMKRAEYYKNLFDPETKLMRGKDSNGKWRTPFNPFYLCHGGTRGGDYTEGNAWQYSWHVQQDVDGLVQLMGGKEAFCPVGHIVRTGGYGRTERRRIMGCHRTDRSVCTWQ